MVPKPSLITHHEAYNENQSPIAASFSTPVTSITPTSPFVNSDVPAPAPTSTPTSTPIPTSTPTLVSTPTNKSTSLWTTSETRILIEEVGQQQKSLQQVKDPREK